MAKTQIPEELPFFAQAGVGSALTVASGLAFLLLCMILPLVGQAGAAAPHYHKNFAAFLGMLIFSFALAAIAVFSKQARRKVDQSPPPYFSLGLCAIYTVLLIALLAGLLKI